VGGEHGPGRHFGSDDPPASMPEGHRPPANGHVAPADGQAP
jgi:hypothetical protein